MIRDALIVTHGMGEQIRYESVDVLVEGLKRSDGVQVTETNARTVQVEGCSALQRAELVFQTPAGPRELHLYEAYWAPLTEGNVGVWDSVKFLLSGGLNGFVKRGRQFYRVLFEQPKWFTIPVSATFAVVAVALAVASLLLFNLIATLVLTKKLWNASDQLQQDVITIIGLVVATMAAYALLLAAAMMGKASPPASAARHRLARALGALAYPAIFGVLASMILGAGMVLLLIVRDSDIVGGTIDYDAWRRCTFSIVIGAATAMFFGYRARPSNERLAALLRLLGHAGILMLLVTAAVWILEPVTQFLDWKRTIGDCRSAAGLAGILPSQGPTPEAGLYTKLFECSATAAVTPRSWMLLAAVVLYFVAAAIVYALQRPSPVRPKDRPAATYATVVLGAIAFPFAAYRLLATANIARLHWFGAGGFLSLNRRILFLVPWVAILCAGLLARGFLVAYLGDVTAYVATHKLDRFNEVRAKIKETVEAVFRSVYLMKTAAGMPMYRQVAVVAHSLGSVISFDALNAMLLEETLQPQKKLDVRRRTTLFLTFGSPLDKIAYVYSTLSTATDITRELLTGAAKPLISDITTRIDLAWVNLWSQSDIVSGPLNFYDPPAPHWPVFNFRDPYATTPLTAHVEYLRHDLLYWILTAWHML